MQKLHGQELIKAIGVSNFYPDRLVDLDTGASLLFDHRDPAMVT
jgi:diketogulonate reductase-like aldo/keto reductase